MWQSKSFQGLWLTDFDGTIKPEGEAVAAADKTALKRLGEAGWFRAVATGRSLFGFAKAWEKDLELDALIFSSGVGLCAWSAMGPGPLLTSRIFEEDQARSAVEAASELGYGFYAYQAPPDNHHFYFHRPARKTPLGFEKRLDIFKAQASPWLGPGYDFNRRPLSQVMIMAPAEEADQAQDLFERLAPGLSLVRSSSPFGDGCLWLEAYPPGISKGRAAALLAESLGLGPEQSVALGNDYNDDDLLAWAGRGFVTEDAPPSLTGRHPTMPAAGRGGLAWAAARILGD